MKSWHQLAKMKFDTVMKESPKIELKSVCRNLIQVKLEMYFVAVDTIAFVKRLNYHHGQKEQVALQQQIFSHRVNQIYICRISRMP